MCCNDQYGPDQSVDDRNLALGRIDCWVWCCVRCYLPISYMANTLCISVIVVVIPISQVIVFFHGLVEFYLLFMLLVDISKFFHTDLWRSTTVLLARGTSGLHRKAWAVGVTDPPLASLEPMGLPVVRRLPNPPDARSSMQAICRTTLMMTPCATSSRIVAQ